MSPRRAVAALAAVAVLAACGPNDEPSEQFEAEPRDAAPNVTGATSPSTVPPPPGTDSIEVGSAGDTTGLVVQP